MLQLLEVLFGQVVFAHEFVLSGVELPLVTLLLLGLQSLEDGRPDHQVGEDADDEGESPGVLSLHDRRKKGEMRYVQVGELRLFLRPSPDALRIQQRRGGGGTFGDGAVLSAPPPHHSWVATVFGLSVTDLYLDSTEKKNAGQSHRPSEVAAEIMRALLSG